MRTTVVRRGAPHDGASYLFVNTPRDDVVAVPVHGHELTQDERTETLHVPAGAVRVVREDVRR